MPGSQIEKWLVTVLPCHAPVPWFTCIAGIADTAPKRCGLLTDLVTAAAIASNYPPTDNLGSVDEGELRDILTAMKRAPGGLNAVWDLMNANFGSSGAGLPGLNILPKVCLVCLLSALCVRVCCGAGKVRVTTPSVLNVGVCVTAGRWS